MSSQHAIWYLMEYEQRLPATCVVAALSDRFHDCEIAQRNVLHTIVVVVAQSVLLIV